MTETKTENQHKESEKVKFRLVPPGMRYSRLRWAVPFVAQLIAGTALVSMPALVARIITLHSQGDFDQAWNFTWLLGAIILLLSLNELVGFGTAFRTIYMIERDWKLYTGSMVPKVAGQADAGQIIALINKDARSIAQMYMPFQDIFFAVPVVVLGTVQLWFLSPTVAVTTLTGFGLTIFALTKVSKTLEKRADVFRDKIGSNTSKASDIASSVRTILGLGAGKTMMARYRESAEEVRASQMRYESVQSWSSALRISLVGFITLVAVGLALRGTVEEGTWITEIPAEQLVTVAGIITMMLGPLWAVEMTLFSWRNARVALKRVERLEKQTREFSVGRDSGQDGADEGLSLCVADLPGEEKLASGVVYLNSRTAGLTAQEMAEWLANQLRQQVNDPRQVLLSEPNPVIFAGTLREHLELGTGGLSDSQAIELLKITDSEEIAQRLGGANPAEYFRAEIASEGSNLSGGQRQRLALARALAQNRAYLVLTEPLNSVDEPSQRYVLDQLESRVGEPGILEQFRAVFVISTTVEVQKRIERQNKTVGET